MTTDGEKYLTPYKASMTVSWKTAEVDPLHHVGGLGITIIIAGYPGRSRKPRPVGTTLAARVHR